MVYATKRCQLFFNSFLIFLEINNEVLFELKIMKHYISLLFFSKVATSIEFFQRLSIIKLIDRKGLINGHYSVFKVLILLSETLCKVYKLLNGIRVLFSSTVSSSINFEKLRLILNSFFMLIDFFQLCLDSIKFSP